MRSRRQGGWALLLLLGALGWTGLSPASALPLRPAADPDEVLAVRVARDLMAKGDARLARGEVEEALALYGQAQKILAGEVPVAVVAVQYSLECGASGGEFTPKVSDFPGGAWQGYGLGADEADALRNLLSAGFTAVASYRKSCKPWCPDGSTPPEGQCISVVTSSKPSSVKPEDYGSRPWKVTQQADGRTRIGPVTVTKLPADIKAAASCTACTKCAAADGLGGN